MQQEERVTDRQKGGWGVNCTMAPFATTTNESDRFRVVYGF